MSRSAFQSAAAGLLLGGLCLAEASDRPVWHGQVSVVDGDTVKMRGQRLRLLGIDAPESSQLCYLDGKPWRCGQWSALALDEFVGRSHLLCSELYKDRNKRPVVTCSKEGEDVGSWLVSRGWAVEWRRYSKGRYSVEDSTGRLSKSGIWSSQFVMPWQWRRGERVQ